MKLTELKSVCAVAKAGFSVTAAAELLNTSQPGVSRHIRSVEGYLGVELFERHRNRLIGLTSSGEVLISSMHRTIEHLEALERTAADMASGIVGSLTVATSHTHARYLLPSVIEEFIETYPDVKLRLRQGYVKQIADWLDEGEADVSVSSAPAGYSNPRLIFHPFYQIHRIIITKKDHPLLQISQITINDLSRYPIITYDSEFAARAEIDRVFSQQRLSPNVVLSATDTDTMKAYVACGLGIAIVANTSFNERADRELSAIDARHLFPSTKVHIGLRRGTLNPHARKLIELLDPEVNTRNP